MSRIQVIDSPIHIVAITGGREVRPTPASLRAFVQWLRIRRVGIMVHGACPLRHPTREIPYERSVDAIVSRTVIQETDVAVESWPALWGKYKGAAGPIRSGFMLEGDRRDWGGVHMHRPADILVAWPGDSGTRRCREHADRLGIEVAEIAEIERWVRAWRSAS